MNIFGWILIILLWIRVVIHVVIAIQNNEDVSMGWRPILISIATLVIASLALGAISFNIG